MHFEVGYPPLYVTFSVCPSIHSSVCLSIWPSICLSLSACRAPYLRNCTSDDIFLDTCVKWWYLQGFSIYFFFEFWFFLAGRRGGGKRAKDSQKWKIELHLSHAISQEQYNLWSWFLVHLCKMMICPDILFHFIF